MGIFVLLVAGTTFSVAFQEKASAVTNNALNFQGRLTSNTGALVPDGTYNMEFNLYTVASGGTTQWTESRLNSATNGVVVRNGYFSVRLGDTTNGGTAFPTNINWDQEQWLGMTVRGTGSCAWGACTPTDAEMTPRFKLTAVPYAFRAGAIVDAGGNAKTADDFAQLSPSTVQTINTALAALRLNQTGSGSIVQFQGDGTNVFTVDKTGATVLGAGITIGNSTSTTAGTIRWNGSAFQGYNGASWIPFTSSGAVMPFVSKTKTADETQNNTINPTATLQSDDELFFSIGANETWNFRFVIQANVNATPDIKFSVTAPTGAICRVGVSDPEGATSVANLGCGVSSGLVPGNTTDDIYEVVGSVSNGASAGVVTLNWAQNTANAANVTVRSGSFLEALRSVGGASTDVAFIQDGNSFGGLAVLGTNDNYGLSFETNGVERLQILAGGNIRASGNLIANRTSTGVTGTTLGTGSNTTTLTLGSDSFSVNDVVFIDNVGQDYYTRITNDLGTGTYTVSPAITFENGRTVTAYNVQNIGATTTDYSNQANRFFQGYFLGGVIIGAGSTTISDGAIDSTTTLRIQQGGGDVELGGGLTVLGTLTGDASGLTNISSAAINGATLTGLNADNIASGTLNDTRLSANVALLSGLQTFTDTKTFSSGLIISGGNLSVDAGTISASGSITGATIVGDGSGLTNLSAGNIVIGTLSDSRLSSSVTLLGNSFNGANQLVRLNAGGELPALDGSGLTNLTAANLTGALPALSGANLVSLNATNISSGTLSDSRLSSNVTLLGNTFNGANQLVRLNGAGVLPALDGSGLTNLSASNLTGALPAISGVSLVSLNATNISSGTLDDGRLSNNVALLNGTQTFVDLKTFGAGLSISSGGASITGDVIITGQISGATIVGDGAGITNVSAGNIATGTLADARLSSNVVLLSGNQTLTGTKTFSNGLVLGQSTITSLATVSRAVSLPDEAGTICLSNTNTCGYLRLAAGSLQTDASNNDVLAVNKTSATGNLINLQRSGGAVFTVSNSGALQIQSTSTTALDIRNAGGTSFFSVDSSTGLVRVGSATADGTGVLFVLDTKNTAGDPTGIEGASYYNSNAAKFRCYEGGEWKDCIEPINNVTLMDSFDASAAATNLALNTTNCVSDPNLRMMMNLTGQSRLRFVGRIGGTLAAATTIRLQYHLGGDPSVATGDAGWTTLVTSAGGHTANTFFYTTEAAIPANAQTNNVLVRACLFSGNGTADPTITGVTINTYD